MTHPSRPDDPTVVFFGSGESSEVERAKLELACRFYGFRLVAVAARPGGEWSSPEADEAAKAPILVVLDGPTLSAAPMEQVQAWRTYAGSFAVPIAVMGISPECRPEALAVFAGGLSLTPCTAEVDASLWVHAEEPSVTGYELRGIRLALGTGPASALKLPLDSRVRTLLGVGRDSRHQVPAMARVSTADGTCYFAARTASVQTGPGVSWAYDRTRFAEIVPAFLLVREVGAARCWQPAAALANLTIDDPWLSESYGCVTYAALLDEMRRERFHTTIGFVPWNYDRNSAGVLKLFQNHSEYLSVSVHGNNHDHYEFYRYQRRPGDRQRAKSLAEHRHNIRQALARMEEMRRLTGLEYDRVMVFPHGVCPAGTFALMKEHGFWATSNFSNIPLGEKPPDVPGVVLRAVNTDWHDFPALRRDYPQEYPESAIAIDLFLGNPVMFMAHHDFFAGGADAFNAFARRVNRRQPDIRWAGLGEISRHLHLVRWLGDNRCDVRLVSSHAEVKNPRDWSVEFRFVKRESKPETVARVTVDGTEMTWNVADGQIHFTAPLAPGKSARVEVCYRPAIDTETVSLRRSGLRNRYVRLISDFRDMTVTRSAIGRTVMQRYYRPLNLHPTKGGPISWLNKVLKGRHSGVSPFRPVLLPAPPIGRKNLEEGEVFISPWVAKQTLPDGADRNLIIPHEFETNYVLGFVRGLLANGLKFEVISSDDTENALAALKIPQANLRQSLSPDRTFLQKAVNLVRYYLGLFGTTYRRRGGTLHFIGLFTNRIILFDGIVLPVWFRLWARRFVYTAHNVLPHDREQRRLYRAIYRWVYQFPHAIVAHTPQIARQLEKDYGVDPQRIHVISIGLNEEMADTELSVDGARQKLGLPVGVPIALFFGKVEPYKGVDALAAGWGQVRTPGARLVIAGWCPNPEYATQVRTAIASSPMKATMEWREGFVPNADVAVWLKACDVVVMPYRHIYQSGVVFLCLRFGVPIVATDVGSLAEYIDDASGVISRTNDPAGIAEALDRFFANQGHFQREEITRRAAKYSWDRQCRAIKHLYD